MTKLNIKNGTPVGSENLCRNCSHGQFTTGYRESEVIVICTNSSPARLIPFSVYECTEFWDRNRPDWESMQKLALDFTDVRRNATPGFRGLGFASADASETLEEEDKQAAALVR